MMSAVGSAKAAGLLAVACVAVAAPVRADLPPPDDCVVDADCEGCTVCQGGLCVGLSSFTNCHCHAECGEGRCELMHPDRPNCGGTCIEAPPEDELPCGEGHDVITVTDIPVELTPLDAGTGPIVDEDEPEEDDPGSVPGGCDCRAVSGDRALPPLLAFLAFVAWLGRRRWRA